MKNTLRYIVVTTIAAVGLLTSASVLADKKGHGHGAGTCKDISWEAFTGAVNTAYEETLNTGFGHGMWATLVDGTGKICHVYSVDGETATPNGGRTAGETAWLGSRVISAQKANTANAFSLNDLAISTGAVTVATYEGGSLFGLQGSNPIDGTQAYKGPSQRRGKKNDPLAGKEIGGINLFGGGVALYDAQGTKIGAVGVSGDTSCRDHAMAYRLRIALELNNEPNDDGLILVDTSTTELTGLFQQPQCGLGEEALANGQYGTSNTGLADDFGIRDEVVIQPI